MSKFRNKVLELVNRIPYGKVASYGQIALIAGVARGARQVGHILHVNGRDYPWWRVINNAGRLSTTFLELDIEKYRWRPDTETLKELQLDDKYIEKVMEKYFS